LRFNASTLQRSLSLESRLQAVRRVNAELQASRFNASTP
jgi:hypothetical protein